MCNKPCPCRAQMSSSADLLLQDEQLALLHLLFQLYTRLAAVGFARGLCCCCGLHCLQCRSTLRLGTQQKQLQETGQQSTLVCGVQPVGNQYAVHITQHSNHRWQVSRAEAHLHGAQCALQCAGCRIMMLEPAALVTIAFPRTPHPATHKRLTCSLSWSMQ